MKRAPYHLDPLPSPREYDRPRDWALACKTADDRRRRREARNGLLIEITVLLGCLAVGVLLAFFLVWQLGFFR
jgi:hypothetical protein